MKGKALHTLLLLLSAGTSVLAQETILGDWSVTGSNTLRGTVYDAHGAGSGSPYPFEGDMYFDELTMFFNKQDSEYSNWRGEITGLYNVNDDYRTGDFGLVPERINLTRESGESGLPFRAEVGDYFAYYSFLTLQRSLKGVQLELQPFNTDRQQHSFVLSSGALESNWRDLTFQDDYFNGLSWLMQDQKLGSWSVNFAHNFRDNSFKAGTLDRNQYVISVSGEVPFTLAAHQISIEAEAAHFSGDHEGLSGAASGQERSDNGYLVEMRGNHQQLPWDYRFRFEHYGQDFRPHGAVVSSDRQSFELHSGWRFNSGIRMRARAQLFQDAYETNNRLRTRTYGINLTGPVLQSYYPGLNARLDAFIQNRDNELITVSQLTQTIRLDLNAPLPRDWTGRMSVFLRNVKNRLARPGDSLTREVTIGADHAFNIAGWLGYITPGFTLRTIRKGDNESEELRPSLAMRLNRDAHSLNMNYGSLLQDRRARFNGIDVDTHTFNMDYRYRFNQHTLGLEANVRGRDPEPGESTEAYRISAFWSMEFDRPARALSQRSTDSGISSTGVASTALTANLILNLNQLGPGANAASIDKSLENTGISKAVEQSGYSVYEAAVFSDIFRRQRLALQYRAGILMKSAVIIDFDDVGNRDSNSQVYERVRQALIRELGSPARTFDQGDFSVNLARDVNAERFIRITEWITDKGKIRFGIPRRLDGQVRMEIQHDFNFSAPRDTLWSVEEVR